MQALLGFGRVSGIQVFELLMCSGTGAGRYRPLGCARPGSLTSTVVRVMNGCQPGSSTQEATLNQAAAGTPLPSKRLQLGAWCMEQLEILRTCSRTKSLCRHSDSVMSS